MKNAKTATATAPEKHSKKEQHEQVFIFTPDGKQLNQDPIDSDSILLTIVRYESNLFPADEIKKHYGDHVVIPKPDEAKTFEPEEGYEKCTRCSLDNQAMWVKPAEHMSLYIKRGYKIETPPPEFASLPKKKIKGVKNHEIEKHLREKKKRLANGIELDKSFTTYLDNMLKEYKRLTGRDYL